MLIREKAQPKKETNPTNKLSDELFDKLASQPGGQPNLPKMEAKPKKDAKSSTSVQKEGTHNN